MSDQEGNSGSSSSASERAAARPTDIPAHWVLIVALGAAVVSAVWFHDSPAASLKSAASPPGASDPAKNALGDGTSPTVPDNDLSQFVEPQFEGDPHAGVPGAPPLAAGAMTTGETSPHGAVGDGNPHTGATAASDSVVVGKVSKAEGKQGHTVAELFAGRRTLKGQTARVRGVVVKVTARVLDRTFVHVRDGSENADVKALVITTRAEPTVGDTALFEGKVTTDKDFGAGYVYPVLLEDATLLGQ